MVAKAGVGRHTNSQSSDSDQVNPKKQHQTQPTSRAAYRGSKPRHGTQRHRVLEAISNSGPRGITRNELCEKLGLGINAITPRVNELIKQGFVRSIGTRKGSGVLFETAIQVTDDSASGSGIDLNNFLIGFGKYKGQPVLKAPRNYLEWALQNVPLKADVAEAFRLAIQTKNGRDLK